MKIFESALLDKLYWQTKSTLYYSAAAAWLRKKEISRYVCTNLLELTHYLAEVLDQRTPSQIDVIYTDFQKAFDKVDNNR